MDLAPFWRKVAPVLPDIPALALATFLEEDHEQLVPGVADVSSTRLLASRWHWAVVDVHAALTGVADLTHDTYSGLIVCWPMIDAIPRLSKKQAVGFARRLGGSVGHASFAGEVVRRVTTRLDGDVREVFAAEFRAAGGKVRRPAVPPAAPPDWLREQLLELKALEHSLRSIFPDRADLGRKPTQTERALVVRTLGLGYTVANIADALRGQAAAAERRPTWKGEDTAESWVRLTWILSSSERLRRALSERPFAQTKPSLVEGDDGRRFAAGAEIFEVGPTTAPTTIEARTYSPDIAERLARLQGGDLFGARAPADPDDMTEET